MTNVNRRCERPHPLSNLRVQLVASYPRIYSRDGEAGTTRWRTLSDASVILYTGAAHIKREMEGGREGGRRASTNTHWLSPFRRLDEGCIFKPERFPARRPVNLSLALLLGPFRSSQNRGPPSAPGLAWCGWLTGWLAGLVVLVVVVGRC